MISKSLATGAGIIAALIVLSKLSKLRYLPPEATPWLFGIGITVLMLVVLSLRAGSAAAARMLERGSKREPALQVIRQRVIAAGLATRQNVDRVIGDMSIADFKRFQGEFTEISRIHFTN